MNIQSLKENIEGVDIYILDQILKGRYKQGDHILDAGCGNGRNLKWFYNAGFEIHGTDLDENKIISSYCFGNFIITGSTNGDVKIKNKKTNEIKIQETTIIRSNNRYR